MLVLTTPFLLPLFSALIHYTSAMGTVTATGAPPSKTSMTAQPPYPSGLNSTGPNPVDWTGPAWDTSKPYPALNVPCQPGQIYCNTPQSFSMCVNDGTTGGTKFMPYTGGVAEGTVCRIPATNTDGKSPGRIEGTGNTEVPGDGGCGVGVTLVCRMGGKKFSLCDQGHPAEAQHVAEGTVCKDNKIVGVANMHDRPSGTGTAWPRPTGMRTYKKMKKARKA